MTALSRDAQSRVIRTEIPGPISRSMHQERVEAVADGLGTVLPITVRRSMNSLIEDVDGNRLIDLASGIAVMAVGGSHPEIVDRVSEQVRLFTHTCFMVTEYEGYTRVASALNDMTPGNFAKKTALFTTGAEAVENAVKIARVATGRPAVVALENAYHGRTLMTMTMTAKQDPYKVGFGPFAPEVYRAPMADPFRFRGDAQECVADAMLRLRNLVVNEIGADRTAAIVAEPIQGEGGFIVPAEGFLKEVQDFAREHGILFIADEIQTGLGRTGRVFASEYEGLAPDLVCTGKALGGGLPISAVTGRASVMDAVPGGGLGGTYAGNPLACAAALGVIDLLHRESLAERAVEIESIVRPVLENLLSESPIVGDVRGRGAMLAIEFVRRDGYEPHPEAAQAISRACHNEGVLVLVCGTYGNVIRLLPPLTIERELLLEGVELLAAKVRQHEKE